MAPVKQKLLLQENLESVTVHNDKIMVEFSKLEGQITSYKLYSEEVFIDKKTPKPNFSQMYAIFKNLKTISHYS